MNSVRARARQLNERFNARTIRERVLLVVTGCVLVFVMLWELLVTPVISAQTIKRQSLQTLTAEQDRLVDQQSLLSAKLAQDPSADMRQRLIQREQRLARLDGDIAERAALLIPPQKMLGLLREILVAQRGLSLESLTLQPPEPEFGTVPDNVKQPAGHAPDDQPEPLLYAHEVELIVRGAYPDVLAYVAKLEAMDQRLGWVMLTYESGDWPGGRAIIRVRTLSLDPHWLGV